MSLHELTAQYLAGPGALRAAVAGMTRDQLLARPVAGKWSSLAVVCHIADFEIVYADRIKRILVESQPTMFGGDPDTFAAGLAYDRRDVEEELAVVESVRRQVGRILAAQPEAALERTGIHSDAGPLSLETIIKRITGHIPHHVAFIAEKRAMLQGAGG